MKFQKLTFFAAGLDSTSGEIVILIIRGQNFSQFWEKLRHNIKTNIEAVEYLKFTPKLRKIS